MHQRGNSRLSRCSQLSFVSSRAGRELELEHLADVATCTRVDDVGCIPAEAEAKSMKV